MGPDIQGTRLLRQQDTGKARAAAHHLSTRKAKLRRRRERTGIRDDAGMLSATNYEARDRERGCAAIPPERNHVPARGDAVSTCEQSNTSPFESMHILGTQRPDDEGVSGISVCHVDVPGILEYRRI